MTEMKLDLSVDSSKAVKGVKNFGDALDDVVDDLEKVGRESGHTESDVVADMRKIAAAADKAGDDTGKSMKHGFDEAGDSVSEFKDEANSTARESAASFDGSAESIVGSFQEIAANAFAGFGPAGAAAGLVAAAGIGLAMAGFEDVEEARKQAEERAGEWGNAYIEAGSKVLDALTVASRTSQALTDPEQRKQVLELAKTLGVDLPTAVRAYVGDANALAVVNKLTAADQEELNALTAKSGNNYKELTQDEAKRLTQLQKQSVEVGKLNAANGLANQTFEDQQDVLKDLIRDASGATKQVDDLGNVLYTLPDGEQILIDAKTGKATTDITNFKGDLATIPKTTATSVQVNADLAQLDRDLRNWRPPKIYIPGTVVNSSTGRQIV